MRAVPIPDEVAMLMPGSRIVVSPPGGDLTGPIAAVEAMVNVSDNASYYSMMLAFEDDDLDKLKDGQHVWITMAGAVVPFAVTVGP